MSFLSISHRAWAAPRPRTTRPRCNAGAGSRAVATMNSSGKVFVIGNWACNGTHKMVRKLVDELNKQEQVDEGVGEQPTLALNPQTLLFAVACAPLLIHLLSLWHSSPLAEAVIAPPLPFISQIQESLYDDTHFSLAAQARSRSLRQGTARFE